ncbi:SHOCT domain-containing protein [Amycolatopsis sp. NPDC051903]|uniref:SHOCT domain-containing protein n=1 Tax=Amycolatopsis sp. NPDC051903 TaxID=3363936 RepID=UPI0037B0A82D
MPHWHYATTGGWLGPLVAVVELRAVLAAVGVVAAVLLRRTSKLTSEGERALSILRERFARGEIDRDECKRRHEALGR